MKKKLLLLLALTATIGGNCVAMEKQTLSGDQLDLAAIITGQLRNCPRNHLFEMWARGKKRMLLLPEQIKEILGIINIELLMHSIEREIDNPINYEGETKKLETCRLQIKDILDRNPELLKKRNHDQFEFIKKEDERRKLQDEYQEALAKQPLSFFKELISQIEESKKSTFALKKILRFVNIYNFLATLRRAIKAIDMIAESDKTNTTHEALKAKLVSLDRTANAIINEDKDIKERFFYEQLRWLNQLNNITESPHKERNYVEKMLVITSEESLRDLAPVTSKRVIERKLYENLTCQNLHCKKQWEQRCGRCKKALYCSKECQVNHWKEHRKSCKKK